MDRASLEKPLTMLSVLPPREKTPKSSVIAEELFLSEGTVRNYISTILDKLSLRDRTQLAVFYLKKCLLAK